MSEMIATLEETALSDYKYGFVTNIEADEAPLGLNEDIIRFISAKKEEPEWMLEWRLKAFKYWLSLGNHEDHNGQIFLIPKLIIKILYIILRPSKKPDQKVWMKSTLNCAKLLISLAFL